MRKTCRASLLALLLTVSSLGMSPRARADIITSNGFSVGIYRDPTNGNVYGTLNNLSPVTGYARPDGFDPYGLTSQRDSYGVSAGPFNGYADPNNSLLNPPRSGGVFNIAAGTASFPGGNSAQVTTFLLSGAGGARVLQIDQTFSFVKNNPNVLQIATTLTNITAAAGIPQALPLQFRRVVNFSFSFPDNANDVVTVDPIRGFVTDATPRSFGPGATESPNPATGPFFFSTPGGGTFGAPLGGDFGAGINLDLGTVLPFDDPLTPQDDRVKSFNIFYAVDQIGETEAALRNQLNGLGINYLISGRNGTRSAGGFDSFQPLAAAIGVQIPNVPVPEPTTVALFGLGLAGLIGWRRRRRG